MNQLYKTENYRAVATVHSYLLLFYLTTKNFKMIIAYHFEIQAYKL